MNLGIISGSLAVETACLNRDQDFLFRHSLSSTALATEDKKARVTARPPTRANQPRHHGRLTYGRDIGLRCHWFHVVPLLFVGTDSRRPNIPMRTEPRFRLWPVRLALAHFFTKRLARISISYLHQTLDFPTRNEFLKLNFKLKGTL
jgi:hypothetical protein